MSGLNFRAFIAVLLSLFLFLSASIVDAQARFSDADVALSGLEPSEAALIAASGTVQPDDEIIKRIAWRVRKIRHSEILDGVQTGREAWQDGNLDELKRFQFQPVTIRGQVESLQQWTDFDPTAQPPFWLMDVAMENGGRVMAVVSVVPESWSKSSLPIRDVAVSGLVVAPVAWAKDAAGENTSVWLIAGQRASWMPKLASEDSGLDAGVRAMAESGFDAAWLDEIRRAGSKPLTVGEREAFDSFVESTRKVSEVSWEQLISMKEVGSIVDLLKNAARATGFPMSVEGQVRRVTQLPGGIQQVELFVETGTRGVVVTNSSGEKLRFESRLPVTVDMPPGSKNVSPLDGKRVRVDGFVYRFWTYQSAFAEEQGAASGQTVPLVVGWRILEPDYGQETFDRTLQFMLLGLVGFIAVIVVVVMRMNRTDQKQRDRRREFERPEFD